MIIYFMIYKKKVIKPLLYQIRCLCCKKVFKPMYKAEICRKICFNCAVNDKDKEYFEKKRLLYFSQQNNKVFK